MESQSWSITELKPSRQLLNLKVEWIHLALENDGTWKNLQWWTHEYRGGQPGS